MTESSKKIGQEVWKLEVEKYCEVQDSGNAFWLEMIQKYGPGFEAVFSRVFDSHFKNKVTRTLFIRKWETVTRNAKDRMVSRGAAHF